MAAQPVVKTSAENFRLRELLVLTLLLATAISCAPIRIWPYINEPVQGAVDPTHANYVIGDKELDDKMFFCLALSGGGSRSANFSTAVMLELKNLGVLKHVDFISSVSGGSLPAAYYALKGHDGFEETDVIDRMGRKFQRRWLWSWFNPLNILRYWFTDFTRSDIMVPIFDSNLYNDATYKDLNREGPKLLINATDSGSYDRFTFSDESAAELRSDLNSFSVARAVNISSAFPGAFQTVTIKNYAQDTYRHLYDGGPADNLGLTTLGDVLLRKVCERADASRQMRQQDINKQMSRERGECENGAAPVSINRIFPDGCLVISVDAAPKAVDSDFKHAHTRDFTDYFVDSNFLNASDVMLLHNRQAMLEDFGIRKYDIDKKQFGRFSFDGQSFCYFWHIALRYAQLPPRFHEVAVAEIKTKFDIEDDEQKALFEAAGWLVAEGFKEGMRKGEGEGMKVKEILSRLAGRH